MPAEVETMYYAGAVPWHGLGNGVADAQTSAKAIELAGLGNWNVHLETFTAASGSMSDDLRAIVRETDHKVLGVATHLYKPIQNERMFSFMDSLVADGVMRYETAGSLFGGKKVWVLARLAKDMRIGNDDYHQYLLLVAGHDSFFSLKVYPTEVRVVCNNTLQQAARTPAAIRVVHAGDTDRKLEAATAALKITTEATRNMQAWLERLAAKKMTENEVELVRERIFGSLDEETPTRRKHAIESFMQIYAAEEEHAGRSGYSVLQAITGYGDHVIRLRNAGGEEKMRSIFSGAGLKFKQKGIKQLSGVLGFLPPAGIISGV